MKKKGMILCSVVVVLILYIIPILVLLLRQESTIWNFQNDNGQDVSQTNPDRNTVFENRVSTENRMVQTKDHSQDDTYDQQHPLKGYMEKWMEADPETGDTRWKWDPFNFMSDDYYWGDYIFDNAVKDKNPEYFTNFMDVELAAIAELTDYPQTGLENVNQEEKEGLVREIRDFLNSFDWRHASDYEKAVHIAERITAADYDLYSSDAYDCLVEGKASHSGYWRAAELLSSCVGLPCNALGSRHYIYPVFLVNGVWLAYEPITKDNYFTIANVYEPSRYFHGKPWITLIGEYCMAIGYEIPNDISDNFPNVRYYRENEEFIQFRDYRNVFGDVYIKVKE